MISSRQGWAHPELHDQEHHHHMRGGIRSSPWISCIFQIITSPLVLFSFVETFPLIYVIELFWNNTKSLRFVLLLRILTIALSSVLILKKCHQFYLHRLQRYLSKLIIISGKAPLNLWGSPISAALPYFCGAPLFLRCSPKSAEELFYQWLPQMCAASLNMFLKESHRKWLFSHHKHEQNGPGKKLWLDKCV